MSVGRPRAGGCGRGEPQLLLRPPSQISGSVFDFHFRIGVNVLIGPRAGPGRGFFPDVQSRILPVIWGSQDGVITPSEADEFKGQVYTAGKALEGLRWGGISLAIASVIAFVGLAAGGAQVWRSAGVEHLEAPPDEAQADSSGGRQKSPAAGSGWFAAGQRTSVPPGASAKPRGKRPAADDGDSEEYSPLAVDYSAVGSYGAGGRRGSQGIALRPLGGAAGRGRPSSGTDIVD